MQIDYSSPFIKYSAKVVDFQYERLFIQTVNKYILMYKNAEYEKLTDKDKSIALARVIKMMEVNFVPVTQFFAEDLAKWSEVKSFVAYFYDGLYQPDYTLPENLTAAAAAEILRAYLAVYRHADDKDAWFARIKELCTPLGYTPNVKEYKKDPQAFKGHVGDVSSVIRIAVTSRRNTPDLHAIMQLLGEEKVLARLQAALKYYEEACSNGRE